jgi:SET domain-containing protein
MSSPKLKIEELFIVLKPSGIHGVGVFTDRKIRKGEYLKIWLQNDWKYLREPKGRLKKMCIHFGVRHEGGWYSVPKYFVRPSIGWYLNHSDKPNMKITKSGRVYALQNIKSGIELTIDYKTLDNEIDNSL